MGTTSQFGYGFKSGTTYSIEYGITDGLGYSLNDTPPIEGSNYTFSIGYGITGEYYTINWVRRYRWVWLRIQG